MGHFYWPPEIVVAVVDLSFEYNHKDLVENVWQNLGEDIDGDGSVLEYSQADDEWYFDSGDMNGVDDDGNRYVDDFIGWDFTGDDNDPTVTPWNYGNSHGTFVSGFISPMTDNNTQIAGRCWTCKVMGLRGMGLPEAVVYAADNGADTLNMSFLSGNSDLHAALQYAKSKGVYLVAAAGNNNSDLITYPAGWDEVLAVASPDAHGGRVYFSSYGSWVDLAVPGGVWTIGMQDQRATVAGTSFSSPQVAATAGMLSHLHPEWSHEEITTVLKSTVSSLQATEYIGTGMLNLNNAFQFQGPVGIAQFDKSLDDIEVNSGTVEARGDAHGGNFDHFLVDIGRGGLSN